MQEMKRKECFRAKAFEKLGAATLTPRNTGGTDHLSFDGWFTRLSDKTRLITYTYPPHRIVCTTKPLKMI